MSIAEANVSVIHQN